MPFIGIKLIDLAVAALGLRLRIKPCRPSRPALVLLVLFTLLAVAYPLAVSGLAQLAFPAQADGSLL